MKAFSIALAIWPILACAAPAGELETCEAAVRTAIREYFPKIYRSTYASDRLILQDAMNAKTDLAMVRLSPLASRLCGITAKHELTKVFWELEHGVFSEQPTHAKQIAVGKKAIFAKTEKDAGCPAAKEVKSIVGEMAADAYYVGSKERHEEEILRIATRIAKLVFARNLENAEKDACADVGMAAYGNFVRAVELTGTVQRQKAKAKPAPPEPRND